MGFIDFIYLLSTYFEIVVVFGDNELAVVLKAASYMK